MMKRFQKKNTKNYLFKMKELNGIVLRKVLFVSIKEQFSLRKGHLGDQEGQMEIEYLPHQKLFLTLMIQIKKKLFLERTLFRP